LVGFCAAQSALPSLANPSHNGCPADAVLLGNVGQAPAAKPSRDDGIMVNIQRLATDRQTH